LDNDISKVIDRTALIENILNQVILNYTCPRKEASVFFWDILLDSSIIPLSSKVKVAMAIAQELNIRLKLDSLHKVLSYRNAFAHHSLNSHPTIIVGKTPDHNRAFYSLKVINNSGKIERKSRDAVLEEFDKHFEIAKKSLLELCDAVGDSSK
jgi:hypothetical protein